MEASSKAPKLAKCHDMGGNQEWRLNESKNVSHVTVRKLLIRYDEKFFLTRADLCVKTLIN